MSVVQAEHRLPQANKRSAQTVAETAAQTRHGAAQQADPMEEQHEGSLYALVRQDQLLMAYHTARLRSTPGYGHLSESEASDLAGQMLNLAALMCQMALSQTETQTEAQTESLLLAA
ncbi:hypothetical protein GCM10027443_22940 [Pontibacter brevis]